MPRTSGQLEETMSHVLGIFLTSGIERYRRRSGYCTYNLYVTNYNSLLAIQIQYVHSDESWQFLSTTRLASLYFVFHQTIQLSLLLFAIMKLHQPKRITIQYHPPPCSYHLKPRHYRHHYCDLETLSLLSSALT